MDGESGLWHIAGGGKDDKDKGGGRAGKEAGKVVFKAMLAKFNTVLAAEDCCRVSERRADWASRGSVLLEQCVCISLQL